MGCRRHHFVYTQGYFYCTKCGRRRYHSHTGRRKNNKIIIVPIIVVLVVIGGFFVYQNMGLTISNLNPVEKILIKQIPNSTIPTQIPILQQPIQSKPDTIQKQVTTTTCNSSDPNVPCATTPVTPKPTPAPTPAPTPPPEPTNMAPIALQIHNLINEQRQSNGLTSLSWNSQLAQAGLNHSNDMAKRNYFEHDSPEGQTFSDRYSQVGFNCQIPISQYGYSTGGENIMFMQGYSEDVIASETVTGWMNSAGHRANILTAYFQSEGIGVAESDDGRIYVTEDFC